MSFSVQILGAGSIGNHLAHACRGQDLAVTISDVDPAALERTRTDIYPSRYGAWDDAIRLALPQAVAGETFDAVIVGTPPDSHMRLALEALGRKVPPRVLLIEKPLCTPGLEHCETLVEQARATGTRVLVGYNHTLTPHTVHAAQWLGETPLGAVQTLHAQVREHWRGIFGAHPWLAGPQDSYLGFTERGGGALAEHSHGINIFQHFARLTGQGEVVEVSAMLDMVETGGARYDRVAQLSVRLESGLVGLIVQDVVTEPALKQVRVQGAQGFLEWTVNAEPGADALRLWTRAGGERAQRFAKTRPDDFRPEAQHLCAVLQDPAAASPIDLRCGLATMRVIAAAVESSRSGACVRVAAPAAAA